MADLIIRPKNDDHLKIQNDAGTTILELANDESKLRLAQNNISASDGTTAITTSGANVTLAGTANNIGTVTSGTFNGTIGSSADLSDATFPNSTKNVPAFQAQVSDVLNITRNSDVIAPFDTEIFDTHSAYDNSSGNYKFTVPTGYAGKYAFQVNVEADDDGNTWERCGLFFKKNTDSLKRIFDVNQSHTQNIAMSASFVQNLSVGDDIQIYVRFTVGTSGTVAEILPSSLFSGFRLIGV